MATVSKNRVEEFVMKVAAKAQKAINEKYQPLYDEAAKEYWEENPELNSAVTVLENSHIAIGDARKVISSMTTYRWWSSDNKYENIRSHVLNEVEMVAGGKLTDVAIQWEEERHATAKEYDKIRVLVRNARNGEVAKSLVQGLGFDVSSLDEKEELDIDTSVLFPCGEKK